MMDKLSMQSKNLADENYKKLIELFPNIVTETVDEEGNVIRAIDKDKLEMELATKVVEGSEERYQFTWPDKKKSVIASNAPTTNTLRPSREDSVNFDQTENLYIEGDNLEVLKVLKETYNGKVKMIYIDPPYNTGKDFVYSDNFTESIDEYVERSGDFDEEGNRLVKNLDSNGRFHTDWLNMIYPRLKLARNLLSDDGVIFISIDDNEQANLKKVCDEIFGEQNFVENIIWEKKFSPQNDARWISHNHDHILLYSKNKEKFIINQLPRSEKHNKRYKNPDNDPRGPWASSDLSVKTYNAEYDYEIIKPNGESVTLPPGRCWMTNREKMSELIKDNRIWFGINNDKFPRLKRFLSEVKDGITPISIWYRNDVGDTQSAKKELLEILPENLFQTPKSVKLIERMIYLASNKDSIILDFFSGSATTAHSVMKLNAEDGGNRRYILVQIPEETEENSEAYKAGYKNICEIGKERIRRAAKKIKEDFKDKEGIENLDTGFRVLKLDTSNMRDVYYNPADIELNVLENQIDNVKDDRNEYDLLFQVMLDFGIELSSAIEEVTVESGKYFSVDDGFLCASFDDNIDTDLVKAMAKSKASYAIFKDSSFKKDSDRINLEQIFNELSPNTEIKVI